MDWLREFLDECVRIRSGSLTSTERVSAVYSLHERFAPAVRGLPEEAYLARLYDDFCVTRPTVFDEPTAALDLATRQRNVLQRYGISSIRAASLRTVDDYERYKNWGSVSTRRLEHVLTVKGCRLGMLVEECSGGVDAVTIMDVPMHLARRIDLERQGVQSLRVLLDGCSQEIVAADEEFASFYRRNVLETYADDAGRARQPTQQEHL